MNAIVNHLGNISSMPEGIKYNEEILTLDWTQGKTGYTIRDTLYSKIIGSAAQKRVNPIPLFVEFDSFNLISKGYFNELSCFINVSRDDNYNDYYFTINALTSYVASGSSIKLYATLKIGYLVLPEKFILTSKEISGNSVTKTF